jgi:muramoyltetrapeptide carboxypeptidase
MPSLKKARAIRPGAKVGIAAPAGAVDPQKLETGEELLRTLGFEPVRRDDLTARRAYLAGDDERRAEELMALVLDPEVEAIVCARGGYGSGRILGRLDAAAFRKARKPLVGYSDITTLLLWQRKAAGLMGIHGPMLEKPHAATSESATSLVRALTGTGPPARLEGERLLPGWGEGRLTGGNLTMLAASLGTPWEVDTREAILMLEEVCEPLYRVDRLLQQLLHAGKLESVVGVGVGSMLDCESGAEPGWALVDLLRDTFEPLGVPVVTGLPFGHDLPNVAWPFGGRAALDGDRGELELLDSAVAPR